MPLTPVFQLHLRSKVLHGQADVGFFTGGDLASLACATAGGKVLVHSPGDADAPEASAPAGAAPGVRMLNINRRVSALTVGPVLGSDESVRDALIMGVGSSVLAYDVQENTDLFFADTPEGCSAVSVVPWDHGDDPGVPMTVAGGACSLQGFDSGGEEKWWSVAGDVVTSVSAVDVDGDGKREVLAASEDFEIRAFRGEESIWEVTETGRVNELCALGKIRHAVGALSHWKAKFPVVRTFAYGLDNGTVGLYGETGRIWRVKQRHSVNSICAFDLDADGEAEVILGLEDGRVEARKSEGGQLVYRDKISGADAGAGVAKVVSGAYRRGRQDTLLVVASDGEIRGYRAVEAEEGIAQETSPDDERLEQLREAKAALETELRAFRRHKQDASAAPVTGALPDDIGVVVQGELSEEHGLQVRATSSADGTIIRTLTVLSLETDAFNGKEARTAFPSMQDVRQSITVPLSLQRDAHVTVKIESLVGARGSAPFFACLSDTLNLPLLAHFDIVHYPTTETEGGFLECTVGDRADRIASWLRESLLPATLESHPSALTVSKGCLRVALRCLRRDEKKRGEGDVDDVVNVAEYHLSSSGHRGEMVLLDISPPPGGSSRGVGVRLRVSAPRLALAAHIFAELSSALALERVTPVPKVHVSFPDERRWLEPLLAELQNADKARGVRAAHMADATNMIKALVVRAEDARMLDDTHAVRTAYARLVSLNEELLIEHQARHRQAERLRRALRVANGTIQVASKIRFGDDRTDIVTQARQAIKTSAWKVFIDLVTR